MHRRETSCRKWQPIGRRGHWSEAGEPYVSLATVERFVPGVFCGKPAPFVHLTMCPGGKGGTVKSRKQAIAIGLSDAHAKGKKVPAKKKTDTKRKTATKRKKRV
jgi:hypothetical protein